MNPSTFLSFILYCFCCTKWIFFSTSFCLEYFLLSNLMLVKCWWLCEFSLWPIKISHFQFLIFRRWKFLLDTTKLWTMHQHIRLYLAQFQWHNWRQHNLYTWQSFWSIWQESQCHCHSIQMGVVFSFVNNTHTLSLFLFFHSHSSHFFGCWNCSQCIVGDDSTLWSFWNDHCDTRYFL